MSKPALTPRMISDFCRVRLTEVLDTKEREALTHYLGTAHAKSEAQPIQERSSLSL
jgi:hypothetical protein